MTLGITELAVRPFLSFLHVFLDDMDIGEIQVNGGGEPVVTKDVLNDCQRDTFLKGKGVPEHMGGDAWVVLARLAIRFTRFCTCRGPTNQLS